MLLLETSRLEDRRTAARGPLSPLYDSLVRELDPVLDRTLYVPEAKALLSRVGGRCETDGSVLEFDPDSPDAHRCSRCGRVHTGELHHRAWITSYQLWLAERAVHAALFFVLGGEARHREFARRVLLEYSDRYLRYPNRDNVLGPTRLFFSTYLESIWLLQICVATGLLSAGGDSEIRSRMIESVVAPSSALIASYDEGMSNRQVWNNAALLAAAALREDERLLARVVTAPSGLRAHLDQALLADGTWYEGENYHLFALRGLWYAVTIAEVHGQELDSSRRNRFHRAFAAPFITALPDFTMPSRKDSQYAVSLRQWRIAELAELGFARSGDELLRGALARCYETGHEHRNTGRARSTADVERNSPSAALSRADLGWRALLYALPELPRLIPTVPRSALLEGQGYAVFRRERNVYVGFEFGQPGGGHGHPDRLNLTLYEGATRWLDDLGTGSYVDPSLHWFRSTLAHNAPLVNGRSQPLRSGDLVAYDEREALGWIVGRFAVENVELERTVVVAPDYVIDELRWRASREVRVELPIHIDALPIAAGAPAAFDGGPGQEDGASFLHDVRSYRVPGKGRRWMLGLRNPDHPRLSVHLSGAPSAAFFTALAPGQPPSAARRFAIVRSEAPAGLVRSIFSWSGAVSGISTEDDGMTIQCGDTERHIHRRDDRGWHIELVAGSARSSVDLAGLRASAVDATPERTALPRQPIVLRRRTRLEDLWHSELSTELTAQTIVFELGESSYRRSELSWDEAGAPRASIVLAADEARLMILALVEAGDPVFAPADAGNPLDNEHADTMRAGVQLYVRAQESSGAWMLVPEPPAERVRLRPIPDWGTAFQPTAQWRRRDRGYELRIAVPIPPPPADYALALDVVINETTADRQRRRGQLVLSGGHGEFVYLRGDRQDPARLLPLVLVP